MDEVITVQKKKKKRGPFIAGLIVLALAVAGVVSIVSTVISYVEKNNDKTDDYTKYANYLSWAPHSS